MKPGGYVLIGFGVAIALLLGFIVGQRWPKSCPVEPPIVKVDTLLIRDTIVSYKPKFITKVKTDTVTYLVTKEKIVTKHDTMYVVMERDQIRWEDSIAVVYASGIDPQVDSVIHFTQDLIITKEIPVIKKTKWGIGVHAGYGAGKDGLSPYVGVGVSYNLLSW